MQRYPLCWPDGWKRAPSRARAQFGKQRTIFNATTGRQDYAGKGQLSVAQALERLGATLDRMDVRDALISTNVELRFDGAPRSDRREPADPGVAVYWQKNRKKQCMAIDRYDRVADNIAAIAATLEAFREVKRHGGGEILERSFQGFAQLPAAIVTERPWREIFNFPLNFPAPEASSRAAVDFMETRFRELARVLHPDISKDDGERMRELNRARERAREELRA